jgi:uncharacterized protein (DUF2164 family)
MSKNIENLLTLSKEERSDAIEKLTEYLDKNLDIELGNLQGELLLDFLSEKIGIYYYNQGVSDSIKMMNEKVEDLYLLIRIAEMKRR